MFSVNFLFPASTVSDTGIGSSLEEFHKLKYGNNTSLSGKWGEYSNCHQQVPRAQTRNFLMHLNMFANWLHRVG